MTTVHGYDTLPPVSPSETPIELDQLSRDTLYVVESAHIEPVGFCVDGENFLGVHIEDRQGAFSLRITREGHSALRDTHGIGVGTRPLQAVRRMLITEGQEMSDLAQVLIHENFLYYEALKQDLTHSKLSPEAVVVKHQLFASIAANLADGTLTAPDEHGHIDLSPLRQSSA